MSPSPYINRFLSADTIVPNPANPQNLNRYSYVTNNPLRYTDPTGHKACEDYEGSCLSQKQVTKIYKLKQERIRNKSKPKLEKIELGNHADVSVPVLDGGGPNIFVPVSDIGGPNIFVPVANGGGLDIFVPVGGGNLIDIFLSASNDSGLEIVDPAPQLNNALLSKKDKNESPNYRPLNKRDLDILEGAGFNIHNLKGKGSSKNNLFKDNDGNIYQNNYDGSGEFDPLNINLNNPGSA